MVVWYCGRSGGSRAPILLSPAAKKILLKFLPLLADKEPAEIRGTVCDKGARLFPGAHSAKPMASSRNSPHSSRDVGPGQAIRTEDGAIVAEDGWQKATVDSSTRKGKSAKALQKHWFNQLFVLSCNILKL